MENSKPFIEGRAINLTEHDGALCLTVNVTTWDGYEDDNADAVIPLVGRTFEDIAVQIMEEIGWEDPCTVEIWELAQGIGRSAASIFRKPAQWVGLSGLDDEVPF